MVGAYAHPIVQAAILGTVVMAIGQVQPCSNWFHEAECKSDLHSEESRQAALAHTDCWMCEGAKWVRVVEESEFSQTVEPWR